MVPRPAQQPRIGLAGRIACAFIAVLAIVLALEGWLFVRLVGRMDAEEGREHAARVALTKRVSAALGPEIARTPHMDVGAWLEGFAPDSRVFVILEDGRVTGCCPSWSVISSVRAVFDTRGGDHELMPASWSAGRYAGSELVAHGRMVGVVGATPLSSFERYGRTLVLTALAALITGALVASMLIVRPVRSRMRELQAAASRLGHGDLAARAPESGRDEIGALARTFNVMAEELAHRTTALETSDRLRRQLIADVSHELMTPLTAVLGHLETLTMEEVRLNDAQRVRQINVAAREAKRLERLIGDLLNAARLEAGGIELDIQTLSVRELFDQLVLRHELECEARRITLTTVIDPGAASIEADAFRIDEALENLVTNALRHTPDGGAITLRAARKGEAIALEVSDSGEGVQAEHLPFIFDRFYKARTARGAATRGSGLGLSIVKAIVTRHGGQVSAESTVGTGTTVRIELPSAVQMGSGGN